MQRTNDFTQTTTAEEFGLKLAVIVGAVHEQHKVSQTACAL